MKRLSSLALIALISHLQLRAAKSLSVLNVTSTSAATRRPAKPEHVHQLSQGSFDDARDGTQSSTIPVTHVQPSASRRLSSLFRRSQPTTGEATALQQLPRRNISHHRPPIVEVPTAQDKQRLYVAGRPERPGDKEKQTQRQQGQSQSQAQASTSTTPAQIATVGAAATQSQPATTVVQQQGQAQTSQTPPAVTSTSTTSPQVTTPGPATQSKPVTWWTRFVCCASIDQHR
ncbi:hypothetical protein AZE42_10422 [Rhizopogon vesiculosus]|uniref:Uncharacterized protein n=1 Tax=Rhizopogon vesiculosus TaxID=180088 RepID=A0A1J8R2W4_9AGAM|nr:hypothetical protein AZE42_10422 [Rhizopogon vesiculosus]